MDYWWENQACALRPEDVGVADPMQGAGETSVEKVAKGRGMPTPGHPGRQ